MSVAPITPTAEQPSSAFDGWVPPFDDAGRPVLQGVNGADGGSQQVSVEWAGRTAVGTSRVGDAAEIRAARAALDALNDLTDAQTEFTLEWVGLNRVFDSADIDVITVIVGFAMDGRQERLAGSALVSDSSERAAARAALDAVNRKLSQMQPG